ncbi:MAG: AAA family ATPase [Clostridiales bacterium]|nr:AAA family ATPase [Clostridiales bacterium]
MLEQLCSRLPAALGAALRAMAAQDAAQLEEIRVYADVRTEWVIAGAPRPCAVRVRMDELLCALSGHALYSCEPQMAEGYIPLPGGHRAGVCGRMVCQQDGTWRMADISSVCIRVARRISDASRRIRPYLVDGHGLAQRVLLLGPPGCGKTTILRDAALYLAKQGLHVAVADEREELFAQGEQDAPLDILAGIGKDKAFSMLLRTMAPQVIVTDEIGKSEDVLAVLDAVRCGAGLLASAHARSMEEALRRASIRKMMLERAFDWYILLGRHGCVHGVYDHTGHRWEEEGLGQLGCGCDGDDCHQRNGFSAFRR